MKAKKLFLLLLGACVVVGCSDNGENLPGDGEDADVSIYNSQHNWYQTGKNIDTKLCDVFYVLETCTDAWVDDNGVTQYYADISAPLHREQMKACLDQAYGIFGDSVNFFAPYYRQITIHVWGGGFKAVDELYPKAFEDVKEAFDYYIKHWNGGRKFVLAGFSQGGKGVKELIKTMTDEQYSRMVAAYVVGFPVLEEDMSATGRFHPAQGSHDTGVTVSYSSVKDAESIGNFFKNSQMIINPVSWTTETEPATINNDIHKNVSVAINKEHMVLFVDGIPAGENGTPPGWSLFFGEGCYHMLELPLYGDYLRENVKDRLYQRGK